MRILVTGSTATLAPATARQARQCYVGIAAVVLVAWCVHGWVLGAPVFPVDDAYITLHNAMVIWSRVDTNYAGSPAISGATSAIHLLLTAGLMACFRPVSALYVASWLGILAYVLGLMRLALANRASVAQALLLVLVGTISARIPHQLDNGLETGLAMAGLIWVLALASNRTKPSRRALPILAGLLPFLRPELVVVSGLVLALRIHDQARATRSLLATARSATRDLLLASIAAAPFLLWYQLRTGLPFPSTMGIKRAFFAEGCLPEAVRRAWTIEALSRYLRTIGLFSVAIAMLFASPLGAIGLVFFVGLITAYYTQFPGALGHYEQRYLYITLPFLLYASASLFGNRRKWLQVATTALLVAGAVQALWNAPKRWQQHLDNRAFTAHELDGLARWLRAELPPNARILIHDAGYVSYATQFQLVDFVGLKSPTSAKEHQALTYPTCGAARIRAVHEIALQTHPEYLVMLQGWDRIYRITDGLRQFGWGLDEIRANGEYRVYRLRPP